MTTKKQENRTEGSFVIPERRGNGIAGPCREGSKTDAAASGVDRAGRENNDEEYNGKDEPFNPVRDVIRKTELLGWDVRSTHRSRRKAPVDPEENPDNPEEEE
ncbi:MAG: hypothetical protein Q7V05_15340 [Methanoregula sp.]|nr:hypothetical protein [Methanoregula sp.]